MSSDEYALKHDDGPPGSPPPAATSIANLSDFAQPASEARAEQAKRKKPVSDFWVLVGCNAVVFGASVCIMVLELTASRLIAKHIGQSLYTWTSVIGVVLAGISLGNYFGGWLADRFKPQKVLAWLFLISGLATFSVLWLNQWAGHVTRPETFAWETWVVLVVAWIFLFPALALGTISPVTASLALSRSKKTGITVGNVYAWGAVGSIVGTFLTGFFLIDVLGTKMIVVTTALALMTMGLLVAGGQWVFRSFVFFGAMQFVALVGLCAVADTDRGAWLGEKLGTLTAGRAPDATGREPFAGSDYDRKVEPWRQWGRRLGTGLHDLGLALALRDDDADEYTDESNYYTINVSDAMEDGDQVKELKLDHLIHSYFNPDNPTKLYYDYERVYAAVTERAAASWKRRTSTRLDSLPVPASGAVSLPSGIEYDQADRLLSVEGAFDLAQLRRMTRIGPYAEYWQAILKLYDQSRHDSGEFLTTELGELPAGVDFLKPTPENRNRLFAAEPQRSASGRGVHRLYYDPELKMIICHGKLDLNSALQVMAQGEHAAYIRALEDLLRRSRQIRTLFIGGGGFVFPRWVEDRFPDNPLIDVAEIDPAVKLAVQRRMGLPEDDATFVKTHIGDARKFIDDQRRKNAALSAQNQSPVVYDFIYGDAFNDYSVPWHLTTREFSEKVKDLLTPGEGVYLVNIIDIYPRAMFPPEKPRSKEHPKYVGTVPASLIPEDMQEWDWTDALPPFQNLQLYGDAGGVHRIGFRGVMTDEVRDQLLSLAPGNAQFIAAVGGLYAASRAETVGSFLGRYVTTAREVFPHVYLFSSNDSAPGDDRDTFVVACSLKPLNFDDLFQSGGHWKTPPFAATETDPNGARRDIGQMSAVEELARGLLLTDDFAPVDNLLVPVFARQ